MRLHECLYRKFFASSLAASLVATLAMAAPVHAGKPPSKKNSPETGTSATSAPMILEYENYNFRNLSGDNSCLGEDDYFRWKAGGELKPGESFTFTPQYPGCKGHPAAVSVSTSWTDSELILSSHVPDNDFTSGDSGQKGKKIIAPTIGSSAQLCMFPAYNSTDSYYTITVTNIGTTIAQNIVIAGHSDNDWAVNFFNRCLNADADGDGWNDSFEHSIASLTYYVTSNNEADYTPHSLWGSNYLKAVTDTGSSDDEVDSFPADFNDDGIIDKLDVEAVSWFLGEGNGITLQQISPNLGDTFFWNNVFEWRRYDLDGDGYVSQSDIDIVSTLVGQSLPITDDRIFPTARVMDPTPNGSVTTGDYYLIKGYVWDNTAIELVEYLVNGKVICAVTNEPIETYGYTAPFNSCWWSVPKRKDIYELSIRVHDSIGHVSTSDSVMVSAQ